MTPLSRREWLLGATAVVTGACASTESTAPGLPGGVPRAVQTASGGIPPERLGLTLMHEHVLVDFVGADRVSRNRYDVDRVFATVLPHLEQARALGCETLVECTPAYLGRDPQLLKRLSDSSGVHILTNTGYYGAANDKHLPPHAFTETAEQLAARWVGEAQRGIEGTPIKPAFVKIGVDEGPLSDIDRKLARAAALTCRETGLPVASHTPTGAAALEEMEIFAAAGVPLSAFIWVHAQNEPDRSFHARAARDGIWVEFDGVSPSSVARHVELVQHMKEQGLLGRVLVSHDAGWYRVGEPEGGQFRPYDTLFTTFVPALRSAGLDSADIRQLLLANPRAALQGTRPPA
jgi:phosphotriesterase-related protein